MSRPNARPPVIRDERRDARARPRRGSRRGSPCRRGSPPSPRRRRSPTRFAAARARARAGARRPGPRRAGAAPTSVISRGRAASAPPISGCANGKLGVLRGAPAARAGPPRSISSPISPNASFTAKPGSGKTVGRCRARPERVDEVAVPDHTRGGEVVDALERMLERMEVGRDDVVERDPAPPLRPAADAAADPERGTASSIRSRAPPSFARTMPCRKWTTRAPAARAGSAAASHARTTSARNPSPRGGLLGQLLVAALPVVADRRGEEQRRPGLEARGGLREQSRAVHARVADALLRLARPPLADVGAGEVHDRADVRERVLVDRAGRRDPRPPRRRPRPRAGRCAGRRGPPSRSAGTSAEPISPDEPVTATRMR